MSAKAIRREDGAEGGRYVATVDGRAGEAQLVFTTLAPDRIRADHTEAPDSLRGTGAALALVAFMVADARARGFLVEARCPYVVAQAARHPEWSGAFVQP